MKIVHKSKKPVAPPPQLAEFIKKLAGASTEQVTQLLADVDTWKWPRSDLNAWIKVLNRLDAILEEIIKDYDLDRLQLRPFTDEAKKAVSEILRFERLLLENSTNRKTYNSYDRLNSLLFTSDLDVLILTLTLLLRPSQQYSAQPAVSNALALSSNRLTALAKKWPHVREYGTSLVELVSERSEADLEGLPSEAREVVMTIYQTESEAKGKVELAPPPAFETPRKGVPVASTSSTGAVNIFINEREVFAKPPMEVLADVLEKCPMPDDSKFEVLCRIRIARALSKGHRSEREKLIIARLLAIAIYSHTHPEGQAVSTLFVYEPDLTHHIAELLQVDKGVPIGVQTAAIAALDALGRYRNRMQEVLTAVNAAVNHGILMGLFRKTVNDIANPESTVPQSFVEALLAFMTFIVSHASGVNMVVGAGLIPLLIQLVENKSPARLATVSKTMQLLDNVLYSYTNGFNMFCAAHGVDAIVDRIEYEVQFNIEQYGTTSASKDASSPAVELPIARIAVLKHILRSMHRMMQSAGTAEGLRNLVNMSLLKSVKKIIEYRGLFGPSILPFAINIMSTFVHNEPTSLTIIQENNLPETFYNAIEAGIEPAIEVIQAIPNAIGALCLNELGQTQLARRPSIIPSIFTLFTSEKHLKVLIDKENAVIIGTAVDELIRHHPSLKEPVFEALKSTLSRIEELGNALTVPADLAHWYHLQSTLQSAVDVEVPMDVDEQEAPAPVEDGSCAPGVSTEDEQKDDDETSSNNHDNLIVSFIDVLGRFLEGLFQHPPHCKDFITSASGLTLIGTITSLPCLPYDFANSVASDSMVQVIRTMTEVATSESLQQLAKLLQDSLKETEDYWKAPTAESQLLPLINVADATDVEAADRKFRSLVTLHIRITLLSDVFSTYGYTGGRTTAVGLLQTLMGHLTPQTIADLGSLHRASIWENIVLNAGLLAKGIIDGSSTISGEVTPSALENDNADPEDANAEADGTGIAGTSSAAANGVESGGALGQSSASAKKSATASSGPRFQNALALKHITHGLPNALTPLFQAIVKTSHARRNPDSNHKKQVLGTCKLVADILVKHLQFKDKINIDSLKTLSQTDETNSLLFTYYTIVIGLFSVVLTEDRGSSITAHTVALWSFYRAGGFEAYFKICDMFTSRIGEVLGKTEEERSFQEKRELIQAFGGLKVALHLLHPIISGKSPESGQAHLLTTRDKKDTHPDYFEPHNFLVRLRTEALPTIYKLWTNPWLIQSPLGVSRAIVRTVLELVGGEGEETRVEVNTLEGLQVVPPTIPRPPPGPSEAHVRTLTDMGFPRSAAERALVRTHNNVNAAAELLVAQPFPLPPDPEPEPRPAPAAAETPAAPAGETPVVPAEDTPAGEPIVTEPTEGTTEVPTNTSDESQEPPAAQDSQEVTQPAPAAEEPSGPPGKSSEAWRTELNEARKPLVESLSRQALLLIDEHQQLLFDLQKAFTKSSPQQKQAIQNLVDDIRDFSPQAYDVKEQPLANRCRLLALVLCEPPNPLTQETANTLMDNLLALLSSITIENPPKWLAAHLLVTEALFTLAEEPRSITLPKEGEPVNIEPIAVGPSRTAARNTVFKLCLRLLALEELGSDELLSVLRLFVLFTRNREAANQFIEANGAGLLFQSLKTAPVSGASSYIATILRHLVEDSSTIRSIMQHGIKRYFTQPRARVVEIGTYVKNCSSIALRDVDAFIESTKSLCQMTQIWSPAPHVSLQPDVIQTNSDPGKADSGDAMVDSNSFAGGSTGNPSLKLAESVVHLLLNELMAAVKAINEQAAPAVPALAQGGASTSTATATSASSNQPSAQVGSERASEEKKEADTKAEAASYERYHYVCFIMQCLSELLMSYDTCKLAFLSYSPKKKAQTPAKETAHNRFRPVTLQFLLNELVSFGTINLQPEPKLRNRMNLCNWAMTVIIALCAESSAHIDAKEPSSDLVSVRKYVLESISRTIKDLPTSENLDSKYGRLLALAELCNRLLVVRFNVPPSQRKPNAEIPTNVSKIMLEKNYVSTLTTSLSEIDLNYPNVRSVVTAILRPLQYLSKIAMKMSRSSARLKEDDDNEGSITSSSMDSDEDEDDDVEREETPDLYRNSALGMYGGEMDDGRFAEDEEMGEDDEDDLDDDVEMEYGEETGSEDTENTDEDEDDEDLEGEDDVENSDDEDDWGEGEEEEEEALVENADDGPDDDDDEHDEEGDPDMVDDEGQDEEEDMMWEDVDVDGGLEANPDDYDDDDETGVPIQIIHEEEGDMGSDEEYMDQGFFNFDSVFNPDQIIVNGNPRDAGIFVPRRARSHAIVDEGSPFFSRSRGGPAPEATVHPLLLNNAAAQRVVPASGSRLSRHHGTVHGQRIVATGGQDLIQHLEEFMGPGSGQVLEQLIAQGAAGVFPDGFRLEVPGATLVNISRAGGFTGSGRRAPISASIRVERAPRPSSQRHGRDFEPLPTVQRWIEETKILHGDFVNERVGKLVNHVALALLPAAIEAAKEAKKREEEEAVRAAEEKAKKEKEEEAKKKEEEAKKEAGDAEGVTEAASPTAGKMETEPIPPAHGPTTSSPAPAQAQDDQVDQEMSEATNAEEPHDTEMADAENANQAQTASPGEASASHPEASTSTAPQERERVTVMIHGSEVDITDTGIDPDFLLALPDDMREEVLNQHVRDQRAARVERPADSQISSEFLDALPPDIRAEILQQEAIERERRRNEEAAAAAPARAPEEIDPASFIASLDPALRQAVLLEQDDGFIASLPAHMVAEVEGYREPTGDAAPRRHLARASATRGLPPGMSRGIARGAQTDATKGRPQHDAIQLLDKAGIATLIRLLFFPQVLKKTLLFKVLVNLCENSKTRTDLFNLLLSILQDGTGDLAAVDKSFAQMSVRGTKPQTPKTPGKQKLGHDYFSSLPLPAAQIEAIPDLIAQKCLDALNFIVTSNELASLFFLTEHELPAGLRRTSSKKGKGKEKIVPQSHYPIVLLLSLLDRQSLLRTPAIMESVVGLLATVTRPLTSLKDAKPPAAITGPSITGDLGPQASTSMAGGEANLPSASAVGTTPAVQAAPASSPQSTTEAAASSAPSSVQLPAGAAPDSEPKIESVEEKVLLANPPQIPHAVLRLIVNILTIGECSGRTFQQSLTLIQNLSYIPDARDVIAQELKAKAQEFGQTLVTDLEELAKTLHDGNEPAMTSCIANKFSPASSTQAKLLRVLKTIDYMYTPRTSTLRDKDKDNSKDIEKVQTIYEAFRFSTLWKKLGSCLEIIGERPDTEHIATVLLPLIESLMVVCKYVGSTASSAISARALRGSSSPRSPTSPKESMEELFISFTDAHRKVLNLMVRNNPSLMSGSFSLLVNNPRVLDFDNKRNYFNQQLHRRPHIREHHGTLQLNVRRSRVFEDSFQYLQRKTGDQIKYGKLNVRFYDEEGVDAGGVTREWFQILARQMFDPNNALFQPCAADKLTYQPNKNSWVNPEHLSFFKFVGRVIGKAIYDGRLLDAYFARSLYRQLLGKPVDYKDVEWVDPEYYKSLCWILDNDPTLLDLTFSVEADEFGVNRIIPLKEGGESIAVTNENKREFVQLSASYRLYSSIKDQIESLLSGFYEIIPKDLITIFNEQELELLISGTPDIDVDEWRAATEYVGYSSTDPNIVWWWRALKSFNRDERAKVLSFATGTSKVPLNGFTELQGVQGVQRFSIHRAYGENDRLPQAHTCFNQIDLPQYSSYEMLRQQLLLAINEGGEGFAFS